MKTNLYKVYEAHCLVCGEIQHLYKLKSTSEKTLRKLGWSCDRENVWTCPACKTPRVNGRQP